MAAGLALVLHALLFTVDTRWAKRPLSTAARPEPVTLSMSYRKPDHILPPPEPNPEPSPIEVRKEPPSPPFEKHPAEKPSQAKPATKVKSPRKKTPPPPEHIEPVQPAPPLTGPQRDAEPIQPAPEEPQQETSPVTESEAPMVVHEATTAIPTPSLGAEQVVSSPPPPVIREAYPVYQKNPPPEYPRLAVRRGYEGVVLMDVLVSREGRVKELRLFRSSGYPVLDRSAMAAVKGWVFEAGRREEEKVEMWVKVPVRFQLR